MMQNKDKGTKEIKEVYRVKLPGNPMIGEGKPENQNHAIVFTRGELLQTIDVSTCSVYLGSVSHFAMYCSNR